MAHTNSCEQGFACNAYYKLYYYIKLFRKVKQFFKNTAPFARKNQIFCVRGNCDGEVDQMVLDFPILADYALLYAGSRAVFATHGHHYNTACPPPLAKGDILLHGHTHVPAWQEFGSGNLYLNPGSVAIPKENSAHSYMMLTDSGFVWKDLEGSIYHTLALDCPNYG